MTEENTYSPYVIIGRLSQDFILTEDGDDINNVPGGHLLYAAIGMTPWERHPGLVTRIGKNYPQVFLDMLKKNGFSMHGIKLSGTDIEHRNFISYFQQENLKSSGSVLTQYFRAGKPFPKDLLGYSSSGKKTDSLTERSSDTILARDIPMEFLEARCIHLCPLDYLSHNLLPQAFSGNLKRTVTLQSGSGYMQPYFFEAVKPLINGLTAFISREMQVRSLFSEKFRISDFGDMMRILLDYGAENVVVKMEDRSYAFINRVDRTIKRLRPEIKDKFERIGELSCFCGAYLVGVNETYDYQKAIAYGAARSSLLQNDVNPYSNLNVLDLLVNEKIRIFENKIEG